MSDFQAPSGKGIHVQSEKQLQKGFNTEFFEFGGGGGGGGMESENLKGNYQ